MIYLKLTNACNLLCKHCYNAQMQNHARMKSSVLQLAINYLKLKPSTLIQLHGGEPMLYPLDKILNIIDELPQHQFGVTTNLVYKLMPKHFEIFNQMDKLYGKPFIQTSWDYKIRFKDQVQEKLWRNNCLALMHNNIDTQVTVCLTSLLIKELTPQQLYNQLSDFYYINFERITNNGRAIDNQLRPKNKDLDLWLCEAYDIFKDKKVQLFEGIEQSIKGNKIGCRARQCTQTVETINPDGSIGTCPNIAHLPYTSLTLAKNLQDIQQIDNGKKQFFIKKEALPNSQCLECVYWPYCNGDCFQLEWDETECPGLPLLYQKILNTYTIIV